MRLTTLPALPEVRLIAPDIHTDFRGEFVQTYRRDQYLFTDDTGQPLDFVEDDLSVSRHMVLRGLHGDWVTWKLVQCVFGELFFAIADLRPESPTYLHHATLTLNDREHTQVLIPPGFANGIYVLSEKAGFAYKQSRYYSGAHHQFTVRWNDPKLGITWPPHTPILSERDANAPFLP